jgi:ABC-type nitrate/sulfonate/bicarbonate transport system substrate-binding protein
MSNGSIDVVDASPFTVAKANQEGMDLRFFCGTLNVNWPGYLAPAGTDLASADDAGFETAVQGLRGKTIGVGAIGGGQQAISDSILGSAGVEPSEVQYVAVGFGEGAIGQLEAGNVDVVLTYPFLTQQAGDRGTVIVDVPEHAPDELRGAMNAGWVAPKDWLDANPEAAEAFCDALGDGVSFVQDAENATRTEEILSERFGLSGVSVEDDLLGEGKPLSLLTNELDCGSLEQALAIGLEQAQFAAEPAQTCDNLLWQPAG